MELKDNFRYLVIDTGYTSRLIECIDDIDEKIREHLDYLCDGTKNCKHCGSYVLFIEDKYWGGDEPYYENKSLEDRQVREYVRNKINTKHRSGVIALKCQSISHAFGFIKILMKQNYCGCFVMESLMSLQLLDDILVAKFDCESG